MPPDDQALQPPPVSRQWNPLFTASILAAADQSHIGFMQCYWIGSRHVSGLDSEDGRPIKSSRLQPNIVSYARLTAR